METTAIQDYQPLIRRVAVMNRPSTVDLDDAISAATLALLDCIRRKAYDGRNKAEFQTYIIAAMKYAVWNLYRPEVEQEVPYTETHQPIGNSKELQTIGMRRLIASKLQTLPDREKDIICRSFGIGRDEQTVREIGVDLNISHVRVVQIRQRALLRLKNSLNSNEADNG